MERDLSKLMFLPINIEEFREQLRTIIREEIAAIPKPMSEVESDTKAKVGLPDKPLYKTNDLCELFDVSRQTVHSWIKVGKLRPYKNLSRVFFRPEDVLALLKESEVKSKNIELLKIYLDDLN